MEKNTRVNKDSAKGKKESTKNENTEEENVYDNFEMEFKMMENQMYSWLISSAYPQLDTEAGRNRNRRSGTQKKSGKERTSQTKNKT